MTILSLMYAPHPDLKKISDPVTSFDNALKNHVQDLLDTIEYEQAVGMASPMVGVPQRIIAIDMRDNKPLYECVFINPEIIERSTEMQTHEEASLCFPSISADISRPSRITLRYHTIQGEQKTETFEGFTASVIQHEMDYLDGKSYLDHLSKLKKDTLLRKMQKFIKHYTPHVHGEHCNH
jgi:peptide deformylase